MLLKLLTVSILVSQGLTAMRRGPHHPHGQRPVDPKHHHYVPLGSKSITKESHLLHDQRHLEEDAKHLTPEMLARMTPDELEFHYFSVHDSDHNSKLDGLEMLKAVYHTVDHPDETGEYSNIEIYTSLVDYTLNTDDRNGDGYISYAEYRASRGAEKNRGVHGDPTISTIPAAVVHPLPT